MRLGPYRALEHHFAFELTDEHLASWLQSAFRNLNETSSVDVTYSIQSLRRSRFAVAAGEVVLSGPVHPSRIVPLVMSNLNRAVARSARQHLVLHAGVVGVGCSAVLLPGSSGSGKSTMTATAGRLGHPYGADEHGAIRLQDHRVEPIAKPLALKSGSAHLFADLAPTTPVEMVPFFREQLFIPPDALGGGVLTAPTPVIAIAFPAYVQGVTTTLREIPPASTLMRLREQAWNFGLDPGRAFATLAALARDAPAYDLEFSDSQAAWRVLTDRLG